MSAGTERKAISTFAAWQRDIERRGNQHERRGQINNAADLLGPGFGPTAIKISDWNQDEAAFNGFFFSDLEAINAPDSTIAVPSSAMQWDGITIAEPGNDFGVQIAWSARTDPIRQYTRRWSTILGQTREYTPWRGDNGWQLTGISPLTGCTVGTGDFLNWRSDGYTVWLNARVQLTVDIGPSSANGNLANTPLLLLPDSCFLSAPHSAGIVSGGLSGEAMVSWSVGGANVVLTGVSIPGFTLHSGDHVYVSGSYKL